MQRANSSIDINQSNQQIQSEISALNTLNETNRAEKKIRREKKDFFAESVEKTASQLNKIKEQQKRFQRNVPTTTSQLINFIGLTKGTGGHEMRAIRNLLLSAAVKSEAEIKNIIQEEALKAVGCSQDQKYTGINPAQLQNFDLLPTSNFIYVPVQSLDLITLVNGLLKEDIQSPIGKILYETFPVGVFPGVYRPFGGEVPFPFNKLLYELTQSTQSFNQQYSTYYTGKAGQDLMDIKYVTTNEFGVTGNYFKVGLVNRGANLLDPSNRIGEWLFDYYATIQLFDTTQLTAQILQFISQFMSMYIPAASGPIDTQSKFYLILQRILGLCFDQKSEIDVSGVAKVAELDGVDDSFFEFTEVDLRNIDLNVNNVQNGVMEFEDCDNVQVPVDFQNLVNQLVNFRDTITGQTLDQQIQTMEKIIDSLSENPNWKLYIPASFSASADISKGIIENLALAVASAALSPKVLLPIFILLKVTENSYALSYNQAVSGVGQLNPLLLSASNIVTDAVDFVKKFKTFFIQVVSRIGAIFIRNLFQLLEKELVNIVTQVVGDILKDQDKKRYSQSLRLVALAVGLSANIIKGALDYRKCQSLMDEIKNIISLISKIPTKRKKIPLVLAILSDFLPGESPQRAFHNTIKYLQDAGIPTGALPNGQPNLMLLYNLATHRGRTDEQAQNGVNDTYCFQGKCYSLPR